MPNDYLDKVTLNGTTYDIKDTVSGYTSNVGTVTGVKINATTKSPDASGTVDLGTVVTSETDPTVPSWAKAASKPTYTASEVGAVPTSRTVNGKALSSNITLSASDVGALYWLIYGTQVIFDEVAEAISGGTDVLVLYKGDTTSLTLPLYAYELTENTLYLKFTNAEVASVLGQSNIDGITIEYSTSNGWSYNEVTVDTTVVDTYSSTGTHAISGTGVAAALGTLDSSISETTGQAISAITITNGKITGSSKVSVGDANQNAFSNVKVGSTTISADTTTDTLELAASGLVTLTPDATNDKVTISASYTETDPTVPSWAKASTKPTYTASEVGAVPTSRTVNGKALSSDITLSASDVSALPDSTVIPQGTVTSVATGTGLTGGTITASGTISLDGTYGLTTSDITTGTDTTNKLISAKTLADTLGGLGGGTITGVTAGTGLSGGGTSGGVTLNHSNSVTAQSTKGIYPIAIDAQGHISDYGAAIIPADGNSTGAAERTAAIPFAKVDSTSTSTVFTATVPGITELVDGTCCYLMNGVVTSASGWTLNVNGLGAKPVYQTLGAASVTTTIFNVNYTMLFVYNSQRISGGCWDIFYGYNSNTTYTNASLGQGYGTCATAAATKAKAVTLSSYSLTTGGVVAVKFTYDVPAGATLNVNSKGAKAIYYHGAAITDGIIKAGDVAYFIYSTYYHLLGVDDIIHPASSVASIDGTSATGTSIDYARADHKHSLTSGAVTGALGYTPYNSTNPDGYITSAAVPESGTTATEVSTTSSGGSATTWSKSDHVHSISSSTITSALGYTPYNSTNPSGYITSSAITAHIIEVVPPAFQGDFWSINDTFANILAMLSDDKKVVFRTTVNANKYNYWCYWFTNSSNNKIGLYRYEKDDESIQTIVFTENTGETSLIGNPGVSWLTTYSPENTVYETSVTNVSVNNGTWKSIASLTLPAGTYIMQGNPRFGSVTNKGSRQVCISTSQNSNDTHGKIVYDFQATSGSSNVIGMQTSYIITLTSETTVYLNVFHTQGAALTVSAEFQAGRIR